MPLSGSLCVVGHLMLPLLAGTDEPVVGGAEVQSYHLAAALHRRGWELEFLVCSFDGTTRGTRVTPLGPAHILYPRRLPKTLGMKVEEKRALFDAVRRTRAALVFERAVWDADVAALGCALAGRPFVYGLASDRDAVGLPVASRRRITIRLATAVVAQTERQREWMRRYGRDAPRIASGFPVPPAPRGPKPDVLWVGTLRALKRPEIFLDLAARFPAHTFRLCGGPGEDPALAARIAARAAELPNLRYDGFVPYRDMPARFAAARVLVNTSTYEGFPNTFVLAWLHRAAVLSLGVDPDGLLAERGLGAVAPDPESLAARLRELLEDDRAHAALVDRARAYAEVEHDIERVATTYEQLFDGLQKRQR